MSQLVVTKNWRINDAWMFKLYSRRLSKLIYSLRKIFGYFYDVCYPISRKQEPSPNIIKKFIKNSRNLSKYEQVCSKSQKHIENTLKFHIFCNHTFPMFDRCSSWILTFFLLAPVLWILRPWDRNSASSYFWSLMRVLDLNHYL